jgi:hypothetical protein
MKTLTSKRPAVARYGNIDRIPFSRIGGEEKKAIVKAVEAILSAVASGDSKTVNEQESLLDDRICNLYGLTKEEHGLIMTDPAIKSRLQVSHVFRHESGKERRGASTS